MNNGDFSARTSLRHSAWLLLLGQLLYIVVTQFHADGNANDHPAAFIEYAGNGIWAAVHLGQFAAMAILLAGLLALFFALNAEAEKTSWTGRFGAASVMVALALYGILQAVDGVALKQAVTAWANASDAEKAARFASAEAIRWMEWGVRSYQVFALALALLLAAAAVVRTPWIPRPLAYLIGLSALAYVVQGWLVGSEGFSPAHSAAIVLAWILSLTWMVWLLIVVRRRHDSEPADDGVNRPAAL